MGAALVALALVFIITLFGKYIVQLIVPIAVIAGLVMFFMGPGAAVLAYLGPALFFCILVGKAMERLKR
ncbi:MAG: hypothetical protein IJ741_08530 [Schwartzia sp.]|nr:hypothetical protein [Schwartzia sp. (in: firmicutes)]MBR1552733.1 hypothetical protein [Schwartzia sp. (in: firmicutes)]MBR1761210.1 hypothetical protein [Schwartzia sp. (in: firmicutes)]